MKSPALVPDGRAMVIVAWAPSCWSSEAPSRPMELPTSSGMPLRPVGLPLQSGPSEAGPSTPSPMCWTFGS